MGRDLEFFPPLVGEFAIFGFLKNRNAHREVSNFCSRVWRVVTDKMVIFFRYLADSVTGPLVQVVGVIGFDEVRRQFFAALIVE